MDLTSMIEAGASHPLLMMGLAVLLGGLHGLEPGHSKTMMAAFIIAIKGTVRQAVLLGLCAAISHTAIVWVLGLVALEYGHAMIGEELEPWFIFVSGIIVLVVSFWVFYQVMGPTLKRKMRQAIMPGPTFAYAHSHGHSHGHSHSHGHGHGSGDEDAHAAFHARQIEDNFSGGTASTGQIVMFGLSGGLIPCAAAVTVLILCLNLQQFWLGVGMVAAFSTGLALTLVSVGVVAALGMGIARKKSSYMNRLFQTAPYLSSLLIAMMGLMMMYEGWSYLPV